MSRPLRAYHFFEFLDLAEEVSKQCLEKVIQDVQADSADAEEEKVVIPDQLDFSVKARNFDGLDFYGRVDEAGHDKPIYRCRKSHFPIFFQKNYSCLFHKILWKKKIGKS